MAPRRRQLHRPQGLRVKKSAKAIQEPFYIIYVIGIYLVDINWGKRQAGQPLQAMQKAGGKKDAGKKTKTNGSKSNIRSRQQRRNQAETQS